MRANHAKNDAQKGWVTQMKGITSSTRPLSRYKQSWALIGSLLLGSTSYNPLIIFPRALYMKKICPTVENRIQDIKVTFSFQSHTFCKCMFLLVRNKTTPLSKSCVYNKQLFNNERPSQYANSVEQLRK